MKKLALALVSATAALFILATPAQAGVDVTGIWCKKYPRGYEQIILRAPVNGVWLKGGRASGGFKFSLAYGGYGGDIIFGNRNYRQNWNYTKYKNVRVNAAYRTRNGTVRSFTKTFRVRFRVVPSCQG